MHFLLIGLRTTGTPCSEPHSRLIYTKIILSAAPLVAWLLGWPLPALASTSDPYKNARREAANLLSHDGRKQGAAPKSMVAIQALAWYMDPSPTSWRTFNHTCHSLPLTYAPKTYKIMTQQGSGWVAHLLLRSACCVAPWLPPFQHSGLVWRYFSSVALPLHLAYRDYALCCPVCRCFSSLALYAAYCCRCRCYCC